MAFAAELLDPSLLAKVPFGQDWANAVDPADAGGCDPYDARARLALYRLLVERCNTRGAFGPHRALSPFWGYASQLAWQSRSGRLGTGPGSRIDPDSWWGACNYALSVVPYLAAMELGAVPALHIPEGASASPLPYREARRAWREAIAAMLALGPGKPQEPVRFAVWRAHLASIRTAVSDQAPLLATMSPAEQRFARGWVRMVDLFAAAALRTDLEWIAARGGGALPPRVLREGDDHGAPADLARAERSTVKRVFALADQPEWQWEVGARVWRRMMRSRPARAETDVILASLFGLGRRPWPGRLRALGYATLPVPLLEAIGTRPAVDVR